MEKTKIARIVNAAFWMTAAVVLTVTAVAEWQRQGCPASSLAAAVIFYSGACFTLGYVIDAVIREQNQI